MAHRDTVGRPMEILLVEDCLSDARLAIDALKEGHVKHRLTLIRNGEEALQFLLRESLYSQAPRPELILLDLGLPRMDGRELLVHIKAAPEMWNIPVVVQTASKTHEDILRSEDLCVEGYLIKPVDLTKFLTLVRDLKRFWMQDVLLPIAD